MIAKANPQIQMDSQLCAEVLASTMTRTPCREAGYDRRPSDQGDHTSCFARDNVSYACHPSTVSMMPPHTLRSALLRMLKIYGHPVLDPIALKKNKCDFFMFQDAAQGCPQQDGGQAWAGSALNPGVFVARRSPRSSRHSA